MNFQSSSQLFGSTTAAPSVFVIQSCVSFNAPMCRHDTPVRRSTALSTILDCGTSPFAEFPSQYPPPKPVHLTQASTPHPSQYPSPKPVPLIQASTPHPSHILDLPIAIDHLCLRELQLHLGSQGFCYPNSVQFLGSNYPKALYHHIILVCSHISYYLVTHN
jgi:hypothetical protein